MLYLENIKNWTRASLEQNIRVADYSTAWCKISCAGWSGLTSELTLPTKVSKVGT